MIHALDQSGLASLSVYSFCSISQLTVFVDSLLLITNCAAAAAVSCATGNTGGSVPVVTVRESAITSGGSGDSFNNSGNSNTEVASLWRRSVEPSYS